MNLYELDELIKTFDVKKDKETIDFYKSKRVELIKKIKTNLFKHHKSLIDWIDETKPSLGDIMYELDYLKIDLSLDDFLDITDLKTYKKG